MEGKVTKNKLVLSFTILASILMIFVPTVIKIAEDHDEKLMLVATKKLIESAESCYYDGVCTSNQMTLSQLLRTGYLKSNVVNPKTKTYFDDDLLFVYEENHVRIAT